MQQVELSGQTGEAGPDHKYITVNREHSGQAAQLPWAQFILDVDRNTFFSGAVES